MASCSDPCGPCAAAVGAQGREQVKHSERSMPLQTAVHNFFVGRGGDMPAIHRLAILNEGSQIEHIITQMDILKFMHDRYAGVPAVQQTIEQAGVPLAPRLPRACRLHSWRRAHRRAGSAQLQHLGEPQQRPCC